MAKPYRIRLRDVVFICIAAAVLFIIANKIMVCSELIMPQREFLVHIVVEQKPGYYLDQFVPGDRVYLRGAVEPFGTIVDAAHRTAIVQVADEHGRIGTTQVEGMYDYFITIDTSGFTSLNGSPIIDRTFFHANMYLPLYSERADFASRVITIE